MSNSDTCDPECWEPAFMVLEPEDAYGPDGMWGVMEAECATVCYCKTRRAAEAIASALNAAWVFK
jgi:hypothetical protein